MEAKDTVMCLSQSNEILDRAEHDQDPYNSAVHKLLATQAEISFKAGIREVVELINSHPFLHEGDLSSTDRMKPVSECSWWQAKLKEWGLNER